MNREEFLADADVGEFLEFFAQRLTTWQVSYTSTYWRIPTRFRRFDVVGVEEALACYMWPSAFIAPDDGACYAKSELVQCLDWNSTQRALTYLSSGLRTSILASNNAEIRGWIKAILHWGLGEFRSGAALAIMQNIGGGASAYLAEKREMLRLDRVNTRCISADSLPHMNSGLSKLHSLAADDGLAIFDSRVGAALGQCVNEFLNERDGATARIPSTLRLMRAVGRTPTPVGKGKDNHPVFVRNHRWMDAQIRASWLIGAALAQAPDVFPNDELPVRSHKLEAALFMMGAQIGKGSPRRHV